MRTISLRQNIIIVLGFLILFIGSHWMAPHSLQAENTYWYQKLQRLQMWRYLYLMPDPNFTYAVPRSDIPLDVVIPVVEKDLNVLPLCIKSARDMIMHPIGKIYVVAPESAKIREVAAALNAIFVLEDVVLPQFTQPKAKKMRGWLIQQYVKLNADTFVDSQNYLVIDADTMFIRPQVFLHKGKTIFNIHTDYSLSRKQMVKEALGVDKFYQIDFTVHHMVMNKAKMQQLKSALQALHNKKWFDALNELHAEDFSEYELYANFFLHKYPNQIRIVAARNVWIPRERIGAFEGLRAALSKDYKSLSMHIFQ